MTRPDPAEWETFLQALEVAVGQVEDSIRQGRTPQATPLPLPLTPPPPHLQARGLPLLQRLNEVTGQVQNRRDALLAQLQALPTARPRSLDRSAELGRRLDLIG